MPTQAPDIDGIVMINDFEGPEPQPGEIRRLRVTEAHDYDVLGTLLPPTEPAPKPVASGLINIGALAPV
jgi:ribosomal protein S12 methylthiotransferase